MILVCAAAGNSQICVFYLKKRDKTPSEYIILNLGCVDFIYCLCNVLFTSYNKAVELFVSTDDDCDPAAQTSHTQNVLTGIYKARDQCKIQLLLNFVRKKNKTRTSKVGAISKAQKAQNIFFGKKLETFGSIFFFKKKSHSAEKCKRVTLLDLLTFIPLQNIKNLKGGTL